MSQKRAFPAFSSLIRPWQYLPKEADSLHTWRGWHCVPGPLGREAAGERSVKGKTERAAAEQG